MRQKKTSALLFCISFFAVLVSGTSPSDPFDDVSGYCVGDGTDMDLCTDDCLDSEVK